MSKRAEKRALELFPVDMQMCIDSTGETYEADVNEPRRKYVAFGYEQAEKDIALTWEDVAILVTIYEQGVDNGDYRRYNESEWMKEYSQDILRKFNEQRKK